MFRFLESICFKDGAYQLLDYHQLRVNTTFNHFYPDSPPPKLSNILPELSGEDKRKVRLRYDGKDHDISVNHYVPKPISKLRAVESAKLEYSFKYLNRENLNELLNPEKENEDIIIVRDGQITDSSYSNLIFKQGDTWFTPNAYLLNGIKRQSLLDKKEIIEKEIRLQEVINYTEVGLINAMLDPGDLSLPVDQIIR